MVAVQVPGRSFALTTDEVYGTFTDPSFGCPWGWARLISVSDPTHPTIVGEYQITELGRTLSPVFATLVRWSDVHLAAVEAARQDYDAADRRRPV